MQPMTNVRTLNCIVKIDCLPKKVSCQTLELYIFRFFIASDLRNIEKNSNDIIFLVSRPSNVPDADKSQESRRTQWASNRKWPLYFHDFPFNTPLSRRQTFLRFWEWKSQTVEGITKVFPRLQFLKHKSSQ